MRRFSLVVGVLALTACGKQEQTTPENTTTPIVIKTAAPRLITATTRSPAALAEFNAGTESADNVHIEEAMAHFRKAVELDPDFAIAHARLGDFTPGPDGLKEIELASAKSATLPEAEKTYIEFVLTSRQGNEAKSLELAKRLSTLAPDDFHAFATLGFALSSQLAYPEAEVAFKKATELNPKSGPAFNSLGYAYEKSRKLNEAIAAFQKYVELSPTEANAVDSLAEAYLLSNRLDEALATFTKATELNPTPYFVFEGLAITRALKGDFKAAYEAEAKAREATPSAREKAYTLWTVTSLQLADNKPAEALKTLAQLEKETKDVNPRSYAMVPVARAFVLAESGKAGEGIKEANEGLTRIEKLGLTGSDAAMVRLMALRNRAHAEIAAKKKADAEKTIAALTEEVTRPSAVPFTASSLHFVKGELLLTTGDAKAAAAELAQCIEDDTTCRYVHVKAAEKAGDVADAAVAKQKLVDSPMRDGDYVWVRAKLSSLPKPGAVPTAAKETKKPAGKKK